MEYKLDQLREKIIKKFYYIRVKDKYDVLKASDLLKEIDVEVFSDEGIIKWMSKPIDCVDDSYMMNDGEEKGWRIQSHFIATDNTIDELEEWVNLYKNVKNRKELSDDERDKCNKIIYELGISFNSILYYIYQNYRNEDDLKSLISKFNDFIRKVEQNYFDKFNDFIQKEDFETSLEAFLRENKLNQLT